MERLEKQLQFIIEIDKVKSIFRQNYLADGSRRENDAEHSWHMAIMAILLQEYANEPADVLRVIKMVLIHDLVEIDAGDTYAFDEVAAVDKREREVAAADRIFHLLPEEQAKEFRSLWDEFEEYETADAKYAHMLDNFQPFLLNVNSEGISWKEHEVKKSQIYKRNRKMGETSEVIWNYMKKVIDENVEKGRIRPE